MNQTRINATRIQQWMVDYLARELEVEPGVLDVDTTFIRLGVSSFTVISMTGVLEELLDKPLEERLAFEYPTIRKFSNYLAGLSK